MKKIISIALLLVITLSSTVAAHAGSIFPDVPDSAWYIDYLNRAVSSGMVEGYDDGTFKPNNKLKYADFIAMMVEQQKTTESLCKNPINHWGMEYYNTGLKLGYFTEKQIPANLLNQQIPRRDMALIAAGYLKKNADVPASVPYKGYSDMKKDDPYEYYVSLCSAVKVLEGYTEDNTFKPDNALKRCDAVKVAVCCFDLKEQKEYNDRQKWIDEQKPAEDIAPGMVVTGKDAAGNILVKGVEELIPADRAKVFDKVLSNIKVSKENGRYYLSWTQDKVPENLYFTVKLLAYDNNTNKKLFSWNNDGGSVFFPEDAANARKAQTVKQEITGCGKLEDRCIILYVEIFDYTQPEISLSTIYQFVYNDNGNSFERIKHDYLDKTYEEEGNAIRSGIFCL